MIFIKLFYYFLKKTKYLLDSFATDMYLKIRKIEHGKIITYGIPRIIGKDISIGDNFLINNELNNNPVGFSHRSVIIAYPNAKIKIGNNVGMSHVTIISANEIIIEDGVMLGGGVNIYDTDFHSMDYRIRGTLEDTKSALTAPVHICKNVFVGTQATILKGVTIGENSIVGACSLVTKSIPKNEVWGGVPARFIRKIDN